MLRSFLVDTLDLVLALLHRVGLLSATPAWHRERILRRFSRRDEDEAPRGQTATQRAWRQQHRVCESCGNFYAKGVRTCPECGGRVVKPGGGGARGGVTSLLPGLGSTSTTMLGAIATIFAATAVASQGVFNVPIELLVRLGAKIPAAGGLLPGGEYVEFSWYRFVNPIFLHGGLLHIAFNGYALANLGPLVESWVGARRFVIVFMGTGIASFFVSRLFSDSVSVGASGALFGLIGFGIAHAYAGRGGSRFVADQLMRWALMGVILLIVPGIDHFAHGGGFVAGALLGRLMPTHARAGSALDRATTLLALILALLPLAGFAHALIDAFAG